MMSMIGFSTPVCFRYALQSMCVRHVSEGTAATVPAEQCAAQGARGGGVGCGAVVCGVPWDAHRCCFSIIRIGLMNGAERIEAPVAANIPTSPSPVKNDIPSRMPNFGMRLNPTPETGTEHQD